MTGRQLKIWPEGQRAIPNTVARSALFTVANLQQAGKRPLLENVLIVGGYPATIHYSGAELRQDDADVWLQVVHMARKDAASAVTFTARGMLKELGWSLNTASRLRLAAAIARLQFTAIRVESPRGGYQGPLVYAFRWKDHNIEQREWTVQVNHDIADLFLPNGYTQLDWEVRKQLSEVGKALHAYLLARENIYPISFLSLHRELGSKCKEPRAWKQMVMTAANKLQDLGIFTYELNLDGRIWFHRT